MICTFASHKGGVGRTFTLVHTSLTLARMVRKLGHRVLLVDTDLDAPGFSPYFSEAARALEDSPGVSGLLRAYCSQAPDTRASWLKQAVAPGSAYLCALSDGADNIALLPAGQQGLTGSDYTETVDLVRDQVGEDPTSPATTGFFGDLRSALDEHWTYVLVDARAGLAELTFASSIVLCDVLVLLFRLNDANLEGIGHMYGTFLEHRGGGPRSRETRGQVVPVATPVPPRSGKVLRTYLQRAQTLFFPDLAANGHPAEKRGRIGPVQRAFPLVHRIYEDPSAAVGEWRFLELDGCYRDEVDELVPVVTAIERLANHLRALNHARDRGGTALVEAHLLETEEDVPSALNWWLRRLVLCLQSDQPPTLEAPLWADLRANYLHDRGGTLRLVVLQALRGIEGGLDDHAHPNHRQAWRGMVRYQQAALNEDDASSALVLAEAAAEAWSAQPTLDVAARLLAARRALDLHGEGQRVSDVGADNLSREPLYRAQHHLEQALGTAHEDDPRRPELQRLLAQVLREHGRDREAISILDAHIRTLSRALSHITEGAPPGASRQARQRLSRALVEQARRLATLGHYRPALANLLRARRLSEELPGPEVLSALHQWAWACGADQLAGETWQEVAEDPLQRGLLAWPEILRLHLYGRPEQAAAVAATVPQDAGDGGVFKALATIIDGDLSEAAAALHRGREDDYTRLLRSIVGTLQGTPPRSSDPPASTDRYTSLWAVLALLQYDADEVERLTADWRAHYSAEAARSGHLALVRLLLGLVRCAQLTRAPAGAGSGDTAAQVAAWLEAHPDVAVACRYQPTFRVLLRAWEAVRGDRPGEKAVQRLLDGIQRAEPGAGGAVKARELDRPALRERRPPGDGAREPVEGSPAR